MNRVRPNIQAALNNTSTVNRNGTDKITLLQTKPRPQFKPCPIKPYVNEWWLRAGINMRKTPTEEEHKLEKMIFECLWDMRVRTERAMCEG